jgi:hypothetical protein
MRSSYQDLLMSLCEEKERENSEQRKTLLLAGKSSLALTKRCRATALQKNGLRVTLTSGAEAPIFSARWKSELKLRPPKHHL